MVLPQDDISDFSKNLSREFPENKFIFTAGGKERKHSVFNGLKACPTDTNYVLIHDGVRPFISKKEISALLDEAEKHKAVIPGSKVKNTIKAIQNNQIKKTIPRENLIEIYTPQVFDYNLILKYHQKAANDSENYTDDASILEVYGVPVHYLLTSSDNIKITVPEDLIIAGALLDN